MNNSFKNYITAKNVSRLASLLLVIFYFIPAFTMNLYFMKLRLSACNYTFEYHRFAGILYLLLPAGMVVLWCLKSVLKDSIAALACGCCAVADLLGWLYLFVAARRAEFAANAGLVFNILLLLIVIAANVLMLMGIVQPDACLLDHGAFGKASNPFASMNMGNRANGFQGQPTYQSTPQNQQMNAFQSAPQGQPMNTYQSAPQGQPMQQNQSMPQGQPMQQGQPAGPVCPKCGEPIVPGNKFCMRCGNPLE